jgi:hypothetical protein
MTKQKSANKPAESEADKVRRASGATEQSSHEHKAREKAGSKQGAGGGAKQKQQH